MNKSAVVLISLLLALALALSSCAAEAGRVTAKTVRLSSLDADGCLRFLRGTGVDVPDGDAGKKLAKVIIDALDRDTDALCVLDSTAAQALFEEARAAVKRHYGIKEYSVPLINATLGFYTVDEIKALGYVVMEDGDVTSGQEVWAEFVSKTSAAIPATVRYACCYTLGDASRYSPEYYAEIKDDYPCMFVHELRYDGKSFTDIHFEDCTRYESSFRYMKRFTGVPPTSSATFSGYTYFVLVDDASLSWEDCERAVCSSDTADFVHFLKVYSDLALKEGK